MFWTVVDCCNKINVLPQRFYLIVLLLEVYLSYIYGGEVSYPTGCQYFFKLMFVGLQNKFYFINLRTVLMRLSLQLIEKSIRMNGYGRWWVKRVCSKEPPWTVVGQLWQNWCPAVPGPRKAAAWERGRTHDAWCRERERSDTETRRGSKLLLDLPKQIQSIIGASNLRHKKKKFFFPNLLLYLLLNILFLFKFKMTGKLFLFHS